MNELPGTPLHADPQPTEPPPQTPTDVPKGDRDADGKVKADKQD